MGSGSRNGGGGDTQVLDGGTPPFGSPVSDSDATQSECGDGALYGETQPLDDAESRFVDGLEEEEDVAGDWQETQLVESDKEDDDDDTKQVKTQLEVEHGEKCDGGGVEDNAGNWTMTQLVDEYEAEVVNTGAGDVMETQLVEESEEEEEEQIIGSDEEDVGEWGKTQLVEDSDKEIGADELSEGTLVLSDNESVPDDERDLMSVMEERNEGLNGGFEKHSDDKVLVDSDASTDEEGDTGHHQMKWVSSCVASVCTSGHAEADGTMSANGMQQDKQKALTNRIQHLPKLVYNSTSCSASFDDLPDCGIDNDSHGYVQNHDKDGVKSRDRCSTAKKLFADTTAKEDGHNIRCIAGVSYIGSQEPGDLSQANAFDFVDRLISMNGGLSSQETTPNKLEIAKPCASSKRGTLMLAEKVELSRSSNGKAEIFEWMDSREDDGGGDFFIKNKDILLQGRGKPKNRAPRAKKCLKKTASGEKKIEESKNKTNSKLRGRFETLQLSDVKSKWATGNRTKKNLLKDLDDLSNAKSLEEQQETADVVLHDVGSDTQMAVEAMEALVQCSPAKVQPLSNRDTRVEESRIVRSHSKNIHSQKRTSNIQEGVTTRSKRKKVTEVNAKPQKEKGLEIKDDSELIAKTKHKQTNSVPEKSKVSKMSSSENKYHGTPVAHRTRHSGRNNHCDYAELCSEHLQRGKLTGEGSIGGEAQNNHITNGPERTSESGLSCLEKESLDNACANDHDLYQSSYGGPRHTSVNKVQDLEPWRDGPATDVASREPHPKQRRTPTAIVQSKAATVTQTAAYHEIPPEVARPSKKRRVFVRSVSDLLKYVKREPANGRSTSVLSSIIGKPLAASPIIFNSSVTDDRKTSGFSSSGQRPKESSHVENTCRSPVINTRVQNSALKRPLKVVNKLSPTFSPVNPSKTSSRSLSKTSVARELLKLDPESVLLNQQQKDSRRRKDMATSSILFSHHLDEDVIKRQRKILARLRVCEAFSSLDATHFVADSFFRTRNMLEAIALGKPVVTSMWLENCGQAGCLVDERKYILRDAKKEQELCFSMPISLASACKHPLLLGKRVFVTANVKPSQEVVTSLVKASSGQPLERVGRSMMKNKEVPDDLLVISCEEDYQTCAPLLERGASVFSSELLLSGIIIQKLEYERHRLFADCVKQTRSSRWLKDTVHDRFVPVPKRPHS